MMLRRFSGAAGLLLKEIAEDPSMRRARFSVIGKSDAARLIVALGQVHPVLRGRFEGFQARRIGRVQAWVYRASLLLLERFGLKAFGQEGLSVAGERGKNYRMEGSLLDDIARGLQNREPEKYLLSIASEWRSALRRNDDRTRGRTVATLNGLTLLQAIHHDASIFPIEQHAVHGSLSAAVDELQQRIARVEASPAYRSVRAKDGKKLTPQEYQAAMERNALVRQWNTLLKHPERDRAIFREVLEASMEKPLTAFVLGEGHRAGFLRLARRELPTDTLFVWITPKELWWWKAMIQRALLTVIFATMALGVWSVWM